MNCQEQEKNLDGITFHGVAIEEHLKDEDIKETESVYVDEIKGKRNPNPIHTRPKHMSAKERSGKVMNITNKVKNKRIESNIEKCENLLGIVISIFLSGKQLSLAGMDDYILNVLVEEKKNSDVIRILKKMQLAKNAFNRQKLFNIMTRLKNSEAKEFILERQNFVGKRAVTIYYFTDTGLNATFEEMMALTTEHRKRKKEDHTKKKKHHLTDVDIERIVKKAYLQAKKDFVDVTESTLKELHELREMVNQLMMDSDDPVKELKSSLGVHEIPKVIHVDIPTNYYFHFGFSLVGEKGERK